MPKVGWGPCRAQPVTDYWFKESVHEPDNYILYVKDSSMGKDPSNHRDNCCGPQYLT